MFLVLLNIKSVLKQTQAVSAQLTSTPELIVLPSPPNIFTLYDTGT